MELNKIYNMDCLDGLKQIESDSIDAIISDPPYQLSSIIKGFSKENGKEAQASSGFMGKEWDVLPTLDILKESHRVLKSGAWALWVMTPRQDSQLEFLLRLRQAGFNIAFSSIEWVYASGFPKAMNISKAIDKKLGYKRTRIQHPQNLSHHSEELEYGFKNEIITDEPVSKEAKALDGSYAGMQLKPARELIIVSQKPIAGKTYLDQALLHLKDLEHNQLGGTWLDDCRVPYNKLKETDKRVGTNISIQTTTPIATSEFKFGNGINGFKAPYYKGEGRFPANIIVSDNALDIGLDKKSSKVNSIGGFGAGVNTFGEGIVNYERGYEDSGDLSRYFDLDFWFENKLKQLPKEQQKIFPFLYVPKASKSERNEGLENIKDGIHGHGNLGNPKGFERFTTLAKNIHPTVKPIKLMSYLISLATREGDVVLDPFIGSGTTAIASILLNRKFIGFEKEKEYCDIANARLKEYMKQTNLIENPDVMKIKNRVDKPHEETGGGFTIIHMDKITDKKD